MTYRFNSDYTEGCHPAVLEKLVQTNMEQTDGYGLDPYCDEARKLIREAFACPNADVHFLVGGTQTNLTVICAALRPHQAVYGAVPSHINTHEAGAIEHVGHRVLPLPSEDGKLTAEQIRHEWKMYDTDPSREHWAQPKMVYISQPTEIGSMYSKKELQDLYQACKDCGLYLFVDGARLGYVLGAPDNDMTAADLAANCDVFYIGGTKCGALLGEAVVIPDPKLIPHFFTIIKQHGALLAKGRIAGIQFGELFTDGLYLRIGKPAMEAAEQIKDALKKYGYQLSLDTPTNQIFCIVSNEVMKKIAQDVEFGFWEKYDETHSVIRFATSWATTMEDTQKLIQILEKNK